MSELQRVDFAKTYAWFSDSVPDAVVELWRDHGGRVMKNPQDEKIEHFIGDANEAEDLKQLRAMFPTLIIVQSQWVIACITKGSVCNCGPYVLSPPEIVEQVQEIRSPALRTRSVSRIVTQVEKKATLRARAAKEVKQATQNVEEATEDGSLQRSSQGSPSQSSKNTNTKDDEPAGPTNANAVSDDDDVQAAQDIIGSQQLFQPFSQLQDADSGAARVESHYNGESAGQEEEEEIDLNATGPYQPQATVPENPQPSGSSFQASEITTGAPANANAPKQPRQGTQLSITDAFTSAAKKSASQRKEKEFFGQNMERLVREQRKALSRDSNDFEPIDLDSQPVDEDDDNLQLLTQGPTQPPPWQQQPTANTTANKKKRKVDVAGVVHIDTYLDDHDPSDFVEFELGKPTFEVRHKRRKSTPQVPTSADNSSRWL